jgi:hypothetical protein
MDAQEGTSQHAVQHPNNHHSHINPEILRLLADDQVKIISFLRKCEAEVCIANLKCKSVN